MRPIDPSDTVDKIRFVQRRSLRASPDAAVQLLAELDTVPASRLGCSHWLDKAYVRRLGDPALSNVVKHAHASAAAIRITSDDHSVRDDGIGGGGSSPGSGR
jgi:hypothetical protein